MDHLLQVPIRLPTPVRTRHNLGQTFHHRHAIPHVPRYPVSAYTDRMFHLRRRPLHLSNPGRHLLMRTRIELLGNFYAGTEMH